MGDRFMNEGQPVVDCMVNANVDGSIRSGARDFRASLILGLALLCNLYEKPFVETLL